ncbi:MAG: hypothetical protein AMS23_00335 [Bacteroides sp. SM1_62]|nr:MAG: hypothetical protein AMS23_00335 [Bacteroides sp. SM1_62]
MLLEDSSCRKFNILVFRGDPPQREWYRFLNGIIEGADAYRKVEELYTIGGMVIAVAHTMPHHFFAVFNSPAMKKRVSRYHLERGIDYQTPSGQRPTLNSFLLWVVKRRNLSGVNVWVAMSFYSLAVGDALAQRVVLEFFNQRFKLGIDLSDLDEEIKGQSEKITHARIRSPEIDEYLINLRGHRVYQGNKMLPWLRRWRSYLKRAIDFCSAE